MRILCICGAVVVARHVQLNLRNTCLNKGHLRCFLHIYKKLLKQFMAVMQLICIEIVWQQLQSVCIMGKDEREFRNDVLRKCFDCI